MRNTSYKSKKGNMMTIILGVVLFVTVFFLSFVIAYNLYSRENNSKDNDLLGASASGTPSASAKPGASANPAASPEKSPASSYEEVINENNKLRRDNATLQTIIDELNAALDKYKSSDQVVNLPTKAPATKAPVQTVAPTKEPTQTQTQQQPQTQQPQESQPADTPSNFNEEMPEEVPEVVDDPEQPIDTQIPEQAPEQPQEQPPAPAPEQPVEQPAEQPEQNYNDLFEETTT